MSCNPFKVKIETFFTLFFKKWYPKVLSKTLEVSAFEKVLGLVKRRTLGQKMTRAISWLFFSRNIFFYALTRQLSIVLGA